MSMSRYDSGGVSGESYDRNIFEASLSTVNKLQRDYWTAKQVLRKKLGKSDDQCIISSDSELDAKLDLFHSIQTTCADLIKAVERYQTCICVLSRDENSMGRFLKDQGAMDKTPAGKMMAAVGKAQCYTSQQRLSLRHPLGRLHHDIETFRYRAVGDSVLSVDQMEEARTHYRASLRWMQDISANLDPEQYKKLEKFRRVQNEVRLNKEKFDRLKWAVCQKVDLLCASRSNLFSNILIPYQDELIKFWSKTARTMSAVLENIKDYQHYEFKLLKGLNPIQELDATKSSDDEKKADGEKNKTADDDSQLISLSDQELAEEDASSAGHVEQLLDSLSVGNGAKDSDSLLNFYDDPRLCESHDLYHQHEDVYQDIRLLDETSNAADPLINEEGNMQAESTKDDVNLLLGDMETTDFQQPSKEDLDLFNDMLGGDEEKSGEGDLETEWHSVFGDLMQNKQEAAGNAPTSHEPASADLMQLQQPMPSAGTPAGYLPSQLMDMMMSPLGNNQNPSGMNQMPMNMPLGHPGLSGFPAQHMNMSTMGGFQPPSYHSMFGQSSNKAPAQQGQVPQPQQAKNDGNMSAWFNLFAELDPLQNPDALGKKKEDDKEKEGGAC